jgi:hypothetical protein
MSGLLSRIVKFNPIFRIPDLQIRIISISIVIGHKFVTELKLTQHVMCCLTLKMETPRSSERSGIIYPSKQYYISATVGLQLIFTLVLPRNLFTLLRSSGTLIHVVPDITQT